MMIITLLRDEWNKKVSEFLSVIFSIQMNCVLPITQINVDKIISIQWKDTAW